MKVSTYFQAYADQLHKYRGRNCTLVEIGVMEGGSLLAWKEWLGPDARVIGIDINHEAKELEKEGIRNNYWQSSKDPTLLKVFLKENPEIDIIINDVQTSIFPTGINLLLYSMLCKEKSSVYRRGYLRAFLITFWNKTKRALLA